MVKKKTNQDFSEYFFDLRVIKGFLTIEKATREHKVTSKLYMN